MQIYLHSNVNRIREEDEKKKDLWSKMWLVIFTTIVLSLQSIVNEDTDTHTGTNISYYTHSMNPSK